MHGSASAIASLKGFGRVALHNIVSQQPLLSRNTDSSLSVFRFANSLTPYIMATMFEPSFSTSIMRAPLSSADAPSMADSLPNINFGFDELRERMAKFTDRFDAFIAKGRKRVLEERNQFRINIAELQGMSAPQSSDHFKAPPLSTQSSFTQGKNGFES